MAELSRENKVYQIREKIWSFRDSYHIKDEEGQVVYKIRGKLASEESDFTFLNPNTKEESVHVQQRLHFPEFKFFREEKLVAEINKQNSWFRDKFVIKVEDSEDLVITGVFWEKEYKFWIGKQLVATVSKEFWSTIDIYGVKVEPDNDDELILAAAITLDLMSWSLLGTVKKTVGIAWDVALNWATGRIIP
ncbi:MAG: hypothetical protein GY810_27540 [Aureispira sp.]|nr:hypothetical protein [Aureispira sp.]